MSPDLTGRTARCTYCHTCQPSTTALPFFEFRGEGSRAAELCRTCRMTPTAHEPINPHTGRAGVTDHPYTPYGAWECDSYYCGCRGWD